MKLAFHINDYAWEGGAARLGPQLAEIARAGEAAGFDRIGVAVPALATAPVTNSRGEHVGELAVATS